MKNHLIHRDLSWLCFNGRVLDEAAREDVPLLERLKFLSIYSANLDEFYRVRIPALIALDLINEEGSAGKRLEEVNTIIAGQQQQFGSILRQQLLPELKQQDIHFIYGSALPERLKANAKAYFLSKVAAYITPVRLSEPGIFFPENNKIYLAVHCKTEDGADTLVVNIPSADCGRFYSENVDGTTFVLTLDDIIKDNLAFIVPGAAISGAYSFKITRDAELDLQDEFQGDLAEKIEHQITVRDLGLATRLLYDAAMPDTVLQQLKAAFLLGNATVVEGGVYHNLKDLGDFPVKRNTLSYEPWPSLVYPLSRDDIFSSVAERDILLHVPYHSYQTVLQFFNQAALDPAVTHIAVTLYRIAGDSVIGNALISAARNGKQVTVFVELKARFDEANNIRWSKRMKAAGIKIIYSIPGLKVHAKVAMVKRLEDGRSRYYGLFATGNFNESTARFYTDHILMTAHKGMLQELELLFLFLAQRRKPETGEQLPFASLLVAQFNLQPAFLQLIDNEIAAARKGQNAAITIKLNNLEEEVMINKLYEASAAGVAVRLIIRGICRLKPGVPGLSEQITVRRIVDRYLEHGRIFIFGNNGDPKVFMGSADWMNRNIYRRIEVCFPVYERELREELIQMVNIQLKDTLSAVSVDGKGANHPVPKEAEGAEAVQAQREQYRMIKGKYND